MITALVIAAIAAGLYGASRQKKVSGIGTTKKYYVYAGYWENFISSEPMPEPYILRRTFRSIDRAIEYAYSFGDEVIYCENVKYDLPDWLYESLQDQDYEYFTIDGISGIGATKQKRRIWSEVEQAQRAGIDLSDPNGWTKHADRLSTMSRGKLSSSRSDKPDAQRYFNQLRRAYKSVAGTKLPYDESVVRNENDDVILVYRDYHLDRLPQVAAEWVSQEATENVHNDPLAYGYWVTIAAIAIGSAKFIWKGTKNGVHRGVEELVFGSAAPTERKKRISYIVSPNTRDKYPKGAAAAGKYPEEWAHAVWEGVDGSVGDQEITNGVYEALRTCESVGQARQMCIDEYLKAHQLEEPLLYQDIPF